MNENSLYMDITVYASCVHLQLWITAQLSYASLCLCCRHTVGLSVLNEVELELMVEEMQTKFSRLAETLVSELEEREKLIAARGIRNKFIASGHQLVQHKESASPGKMGNLSVKELKKWATQSSRRTPEEKSPQKVDTSFN